MAVEGFKERGELAAIPARVFELHVEVELLLFEFVDHLKVDVFSLSDALDLEKLARLLFVGKLVDEEDEVFGGEILPEVGEFFEVEFDLVEGENHLQESEVLHEQDERLKSQPSFVHFLESLVVLPRLDVAVDVKVVNVLQASLSLHVVDDAIFASAPLELSAPSELILVGAFILEYLLFLLLLGLEHGGAHHLLLDLAHQLVVPVHQ